MPVLRKKKQPRAKAPARPRPAKANPILGRVAELASAGQHAQAIELATAALAKTGIDPASKIDLLDLRAESFVAMGDLAQAGADATAMFEQARRARNPARLAQALNRSAYVQTRKGDWSAAIENANAALKAARESKQVALEAKALFRLAEPQARNRVDMKAGMRNAKHAAKLFHRLGRLSDEGRAWWVVAIALNAQGHAAESVKAANAALTLCRQAGDPYGAGNALNMLVFNEADLAVQLKLLHQARADFEAAGYIERQGIITGNLGIAYSQLGLYRRARRLMVKAEAVYRHSGARSSLGLCLGEQAEAAIAVGQLERARECVAEMTLIAKDTGDPLVAANALVAQGHAALLVGDATAALSDFEGTELFTRGIEQIALEINGLCGIGQANLALRKPRPALAATRRGTDLHRAHDLAALDGMSSTLLWWTHSQALQANRQAPAAQKALATAYAIMCQGIAKLSDEGLRRNYLNKIQSHREIVQAWIKGAGGKGVAPKRRTSHLSGETNLSEPFERLVDTGLRLNELRSSEELHEFLIDEATELSGAERVLLVLETPQGMRLAGSLMPRGEDAETLLQEITPALMDVRRARAVNLAYFPESGTELAQRSRVIAPLIAQRELVGYLYADLDGAFGRLHDSDRDLLGMFASQAAVALANARWSQGLEQQVTQRTAELQASNGMLEQRANELAIINSVQSGLASQLDIQAIFDLVGDKVRDTFNAQSVSIATYDRKTNLMSYRYIMEKGERQFEDPLPLSDKGFGPNVMRTRRPLLINEDLRTRAKELGSFVIGGGEMAKSGIWVPLIIGDEARGVISIQNVDEEHAFNESDFRLLITLAGSLSVALRERAPVRRDAASAEGNRAAQRRAGGDQQHPAGHGREAGFPGDRRPGRRQAARGVQDRRHRHPLVRLRPEDRSLRL